MKFGLGNLVLLWAIGIYWSWFCHQEIASNFITSDRSITLANIPDNYSKPILALTNAPAIGNDLGANYRSTGEWIGRLILPTAEQILTLANNHNDWVWIEIKQAPATDRDLVGKTVRLTWQPNSDISTDASKVITNIHFTPETIASQQQGNIHPQRLNSRTSVGALQSLAGARPEDDVLVSLKGVRRGDDSSLTIDREPLQVAGTLKGLVEIIGTDTSRSEPLPAACPGTKPCPSEYVRVRHYDRHSHAFDGQIETIRIPQPSAKKSGLFPSTIRDLSSSPARSQGWYIYGDKNPQGLFTVTALQPRSLITIQNPVLSRFLRRGTRRARAAQSTIQNYLDRDLKLDYLNRHHWENTLTKKGQIEKITFDRQPERVGDRALVIHTFGGIGGETGDKQGLAATVTGHFAYGIATVVRDEFTEELQWSIEYYQVYAHNPDGIIAGKQDWATYLGQLQRGWLATRPVADILISYPPVTEDYDFDGIKLTPLMELQRQLFVSAARYRTGDGTGNASVTPATSCVQDANQALYVTIRQLNREVRSQPQIQRWLDTHPQHPQTRRFRELQSLGAELETNLAPVGIVRQDWQQNAAKLAGTDVDSRLSSSGNPLLGLMSWRTMLPRGAQDGMEKIFSRRKAAIWFLNTFQVGGWNADIFPIAPTVLFGQIPLLSTIVLRLWAGIITLPTLSGWLTALGLLGVYSVVALAIGFKSGFLTVDRQFGTLDLPLVENIRSLIQLFFLPAVLEEIVFRLLPIPHPIETAIASDLYLWSAISLGLFIIYHPVNALTFYKVGHPTFLDWRFLILTGLLGVICTIAYLLTSSILAAVIIHWIVVIAWLKVFGGDRRLLQDLN
jgi:predicted Abi (CAAX) family protease